MATLTSHHSVDQTVSRLTEILAAKNIKLFATIDHSGEAEKAGFQMKPCKLLIFGNPKAGTPLMLAAPESAIDLPLKILVWEASDDTVRVSYNETSYLQHRHNLPDELMAAVSGVSAIATAITE